MRIVCVDLDARFAQVRYRRARFISMTLPDTLLSPTIVVDSTVWVCMIGSVSFCSDEPNILRIYHLTVSLAVRFVNALSRYSAIKMLKKDVDVPIIEVVSPSK